MNERLKGMLGLAVRAGKAVSGSFAVEGAIRRNRAKLVIIDGRASANTIRQFQGMCSRCGAKCVVLEETGLLEDLLGRDNRTLLAVTDGGFAAAIQEILNLKKE